MSPLKIRIYPERRSLHFLVYLWPSQEDMLAHCRVGLLHSDPKTLAQCSTYFRERVMPDGRRRVSSRMGELNFFREAISAELLVHEIGHAAKGWARRIGLDDCSAAVPVRARQGLVSDEEERFCLGLGRMAAQLNDFFHERGVYPRREPGRRGGRPGRPRMGGRDGCN